MELVYYSCRKNKIKKISTKITLDCFPAVSCMLSVQLMYWNSSLQIHMNQWWLAERKVISWKYRDNCKCNVFSVKISPPRYMFSWYGVYPRLVSIIVCLILTFVMQVHNLMWNCSVLLLGMAWCFLLFLPLSCCPHLPPSQFSELWRRCLIYLTMLKVWRSSVVYSKLIYMLNIGNLFF